MRFVLNRPALYDLLQVVVRGSAFYTGYVQKYVRPFPGCRVLDLGCGTASILEYLPESCEYLGVDSNPQYIEAAVRKYGSRGQFLCQTIESHGASNPGAFDRILAIGVLHHLKDSEARHLLDLAKAYAKPDGRLITLDGTRIPGQSPIARLLVNLDRGFEVRDTPGYTSLAESVFDRVEVSVRHDLFRFPYSCVVMECQS